MTPDTERGPADADDAGQAAAAWLDEMKRISREAREMEAEHGFLSGSGQVVIRRGRLDAMVAVIEAAERRRVASLDWNLRHGVIDATDMALEDLWAAVIGTEAGNG